MKRLVSSLVVLAIFSTAVPALAKRYPPGYWEQRDRDQQNRRDARRAGVGAAIVASGVSRAIANDRIEQRYRECLMATGYSAACDQRRFEQEIEARQTARRKGLVAGIVTREIVRD